MVLILNLICTFRLKKYRLSTALQNSVYSNLPFLPSEEQAEAIDLLCEFVSVEMTDRNSLLFKGFAGTGKTSIIGTLVRAMQQHFRKMVLLAPTGRAAKVLAVNAGKRAFTIHKFIYRKKVAAGGAISLVIAPNLYKNCTFFIDEASMIADYSASNDGTVSSRNLLEDLLEYVYQHPSNRIVFIGDEGQLPPVGSDFSPALNLEYMQNHFFGIHFREFALRQVHRQMEQSLILENSILLRKSFSERNFPKLWVDEKKDVVAIDGSTLQEHLEDAFNKSGIEETIFITRSNKRASYFNAQIRSRILWQEEEIGKGDRLMVVKNNYHWLDETSVMGFIANGEILTVVRLGKYEERYGHRFVWATVLFTDYESMGEQDVLIFLDLLQSDKPSFGRKELKELFFQIEEEYMDEPNKRKRYEKIMTDPFFNALQVKFAYAITCHKSQGGQWQTVFIDHGYIQGENGTDGLNRWLYTAFTRAIHQLFLVGFDERFFEEDASGES